MNIDYLKEFVHLTDTLNFSMTAQHFYVSTSVISRHIAALEEELGVRLFDRGGGQVTMTKSGEIFLEDARTILHDYDNALERLSLLNDRTEAIVRVGYLHNAARPFIARFMRFMKRHHPEIGIVFQGMKFLDLYNALDEHRVDLNFMLDVFPHGERDYRYEKIYDDQLYVVVNLENPLATKTKEGVELSELVGQKIMLPSDLAYPGLSEYVRTIVSSEPALKAIRHYGDIETLYLEVEVNDGVGFSCGFNRELYGDRVAFLPIKDVDTHLEVSAFWRDSLQGDALKACMEAFEVCRENVHVRPVGAEVDQVAKPL